MLELLEAIMNAVGALVKRLRRSTSVEEARNKDESGLTNSFTTISEQYTGGVFKDIHVHVVLRVLAQSLRPRSDLLSDG